jgi:hypothetical protein
MNVELLTIFYGQTHGDMFLNTLLPSLWTAGNVFSMIADGHSVIHRIYCTPDDISRLPKDLPMIVNTSLLLGDGKDRERLHLAFIEQINRQVLTVMCPCDHVFGVGLYGAVMGLHPGEYLVCGHPRISREAGLGPMGKFLSVSHADNRDLVRFCMESIPHPIVTRGIAFPELYWRTTRRADHWETFFKEPPPLAFWGSPDMLDAWQSPTVGNWEVVDHDLVNLCHKRGTLKAIMDSREFFWAEFTSEHQYLPTIYNDIWLASCKHFNATPCRWYL